MSNTIANWLRSRKFKSALKQSDTQVAEQLLQEIQQSGAKLSWLEKLFRDKLQSDESGYESEREAAAVRRQLTEVRQNLEAEFSFSKLQLEESFRQRSQKLFEPTESFLLTPNSDYIKFVIQQFEILDIDEYIIQCTGIDSNIFEPLEIKLAEYLDNGFNNYKDKNKFFNDLKTADEDINSLKKGKDPDYKYNLTPHVYFIRYFLEGVYSAYLAWFLVYKSGLLKANINVLDIGAGSGAMLYGLSSFLQSVDSFSSLSQIHISYCSFEQQDLLQYHGLKFWRRYAKEQKTPAVNSYLRFYTNDVFKYDNNDTVTEKLPKNFFDFIVISHCIFANQDERYKSHEVYRKIFSESLKDQGYVLVVVQGSRLFQAYGSRITEDKNHEDSLINKFVQELGLKLVWHQYLTSTGQRTSLGSEFGKYAREKLPPQEYISELARKYKIVNYDLHYALDDYVILAQK